MTNSEKLEWLKNLKCNSLSITFNDHACNYCTAKQWIEDFSRDIFQFVAQDVLDRMAAADSIWHVQIFPDTPIGSYDYFGATLDEALEAAIAGNCGHNE